MDSRRRQPQAGRECRRGAARGRLHPHARRASRRRPRAARSAELPQARYFCLNAERYRRRIESHVTYGRLDAALATAALWCERSQLDLEPELTRARVELAAGHYRAAHDRAISAIRARDCPAALA